MTAQWVVVVVFCLCALAVVVVGERLKSAHDILGVDRDADEQTIKRAYKQLVKQWHPDKSDNPEAQKKFVEINDAYQKLVGFKKRPNDNQFASDRHGEYGHFTFNFQMPFLSFAKYAIDYNNYKENILPDYSYKKPHLLVVYSATCYSCILFEASFEQATKELKESGYGILSVNANFQGRLVEELQVRTVPSVMVIFAGEVQRCSSDALTLPGLLQCAQDKLPPDLVDPLKTYKALQSFQNAALMQNKVTVVFFITDQKPTLKLLVIAAVHLNLCRFAFVRVNESSRITPFTFGDVVLKRIGASGSVVIFKESPVLPVVNEPFDNEDMSGSTISQVIEANQLLTFPRISSQNHFNAICKFDQGDQMCAVLLVGNAQTSDKVHVDAYFKSLDQLLSKRVKHCYVYVDSQPSFVKSFQFTSENGSDEQYKSVLLLRRAGEDRARYRLLRNVWNGQRQFVNESVKRLKVQLDAAVDDPAYLASTTTLTKLSDEHAPGAYRRLAKTVVRNIRKLFYTFGSEELLPVVSVVVTFAIIFLFGGLLHYAANSEQSRSRVLPTPKVFSNGKESTPPFLIRELRAESYFGMVRLLRPGCRTLVVICDKESKDVLVEQFRAVIWPWRKNKTLMFGYVMAERNLDWFRHLLEMAVVDGSLTTINARNVVGTVLALNGFRQYYCVYHPKYRSSLKGSRQWKSRNCQFRSVSVTSATADATTDSSEEERQEEKRLDELQRRKALKVDELLDGLPNWLDRLFDGDVQRFYVSEWPPMK